MLAFRTDTKFDRRMFLALGMPLLSGIANGSTADGAKTRKAKSCLLYTSPSPRDRQKSRMPSSA